MKSAFVKFLAVCAVIGVIIGGVIGFNQVSYAEVTGMLNEPDDGKTLSSDELTMLSAVEEGNGSAVQAVTTSEHGEKEGKVQQILAQLIANKTGKSVEQILQEKKTLKTWKAVLKKYNLDWKEIRKDLYKQFPMLSKIRFLDRHPILVLEVVSSYLGLDEQKVIEAWKKNPVRSSGLVKAAVLAKLSGKSLDEVLSMKTKGTSWLEIAKQLKIEPEKIKEEIPKIKEQVKAKVQEWKKGKMNA